MATIDNYDVRIYLDFARRTQFVEQIRRDFQMDEASSIPPQTTVTDWHPKLSELDLLLGVTRSYAPWAYFLPPKLLNKRRKSPFTFSKVSPSIGHEEDEDLEILESIQPQTEEEKREKEALKSCIRRLRTINQWLGYIVGRIGQLLQG